MILHSWIQWKDIGVWISLVRLTQLFSIRYIFYICVCSTGVHIFGMGLELYGVLEPRAVILRTLKA